MFCKHQFLNYLEWQPNGNLVATVSADSDRGNVLILLDTDTGAIKEIEVPIKRKELFINSLRWSPDGKWIALF